jgi:hypothetical protein
MTEAEEEKQFQVWQKTNIEMLDAMFSGELSDTPQKWVKEYLEAVLKIYNELPKNRYLYAHSTIRNSIGNYFASMGWDYRFEVPFGDIDSSHRFDLMAQKDEHRIYVEVKPELNTRDFGQILGYLFDVRKVFKKARFFLGTDILNLPAVINGGEITDIIIDIAQRHGMGVFLANKEMAWLIPAEFFLI